MSGEDRRREAPQGPPWSPELLADFQAGVLDRETADELRPRVRADPEARQILAALEVTGAELADPPPLSIPDDVAVRIDAALREEASARTPRPPAEQVDSAAAPVVDIDRARQRRRRRMWGAGLLGGIAAAAAAVIIPTLLVPDDGDLNTAPPPSSGQAPLALDGELSLNGEQFSRVMGTHQYSGLSDPERLVGCLRANGIGSGNPLGAREIALDGEPAQLFVLTTGELGEFRLLAVRPDCGPGNPATVSDTTYGG
ncbi:hypothetical protein FHX42_005123 [Saccharopolyspora lacisalsi]|uniref:Anti-sigma factor n=1 Tax=Halosaccharopolyspora lacisalsi TaxID=1000566 RepID=A0A839EA45_9PSEU|nr:hypothetical protein [Halosaccharopolyspora lacisalsi]MBA8827718.1 hypothetical protein [Halosaccharopolyspora lacisalsi]